MHSLGDLKFQRHNLVWLTPNLLNTILPQWDKNVPLVVTRQSDLVPPNMLSIGCSISPSKTSLSRRNFIVSIDFIVTHSKALLFTEVLSEFGLNHLAKTLEEFSNHGVVVRVYGSMSYHYLTKRNYFTLSSDIDLLFEVVNDSIDLNVLHDLILHLQSLVSYTIDGEILFPNGNFVAWREWFNIDRDVLVKTTTKAIIMSKKAILNDYRRHKI